jgi:hypothetical protein
MMHRVGYAVVVNSPGATAGSSSSNDEQNVKRKKSNESASDLSAIWSCNICLFLVDGARQTECCGSLYCFTCIKPWITQNHNCPNCRANLTESKLFVDKRAERESSQCIRPCSNSKSGCDFVGTRAEVATHELSCSRISYEQIRRQFQEYKTKAEREIAELKDFKTVAINQSKALLEYKANADITINVLKSGLEAEKDNFRGFIQNLHSFNPNQGRLAHTHVFKMERVAGNFEFEFEVRGFTYKYDIYIGEFFSATISAVSSGAPALFKTTILIVHPTNPRESRLQKNNGWRDANVACGAYNFMTTDELYRFIVNQRLVVGVLVF